MALRASKASAQGKMQDPAPEDSERKSRTSSWDSGPADEPVRKNSDLHRIFQSPTYTPNRERTKSELFHETHAPYVYNVVVIGMVFFTLLGFVPTIWTYTQTQTWWLNPILRPKEWGFKMNSSILTHALSSVLWIGVIAWQYIFTGRKMLGSAPGWIRNTHKLGGWIGIAVCTVFVFSANWFTFFAKGVAGKITNNGLAAGIGLMMSVHIWMGITAIMGKNKHDHIWHMCGLFVWSSLPGTGRTSCLLYQWLALGETCDVWYTSGCLIPAIALQIVGLFLLRWALLRHPFVIADYWTFFVLIAGEIFLGSMDGSFLKCTDHPKLAQVPGKAWTLM